MSAILSSIEPATSVIEPAALLVIALAFLIINLLTYLAFAADKQCARSGHRRISEQTLLNLALFGGSTGALLAQRILRHKTRKQPFATILRLIGVFHSILLLGLAVWLVG